VAYLAGYFYLYIEVEKDTLVCRDRGYQNGDGFHMVLAIPRDDGEPSDEFYVLAFCPQKDPKRAWQKKFIWYRDIDISFKQLDETLFEVHKGSGKVGFEVLIPWREIYPYHPWFLESVGLNLCYVEAVGETGKNYHYLLRDGRMQSEQSLRLYEIFRFAKPRVKTGAAVYLVLDRNHCLRGRDVTARISGVAAGWVPDTVMIEILDYKSFPVKRLLSSIHLGDALVKRSIRLSTEDLAPGDYKVRWRSKLCRMKGELDLTVLPDIDTEELNKKIEMLTGRISEGSVATLRFRLGAIGNRLKSLKDHDTATMLLSEIKELNSVISSAREGRDVIATEKGVLRRAYKSRLDGSFQPYSIKVPRAYLSRISSRWLLSVEVRQTVSAPKQHRLISGK